MGNEQAVHDVLPTFPSISLRCCLPSVSDFSSGFVRLAVLLRDIFQGALVDLAVIIPEESVQFRYFNSELLCGGPRLFVPALLILEIL